MKRGPKSELSMRSADFRSAGRHVRMDALFGYWFEFLRLSPSYQLAHRVRTGARLSPAEKKTLPKDFARVLEVYDDFGDVQRAVFRLWWLQRGLQLFGARGEPPSVSGLGIISSSTEQPDRLLCATAKNHLETTWRQQARPDTLFLAIPLTAPRARVIRSIRDLLNTNTATSKDSPPVKYALLKKKTHLSSLKCSMKALWLRAIAPDHSLWRIGAELRISQTFSSEVDPRAKRGTADTTYARKILAILTSRALSNGVRIAENAARGIFPSNAKCPNAMKFDPEEFHNILKASSAWHKAEKAKLATKAK